MFRRFIIAIASVVAFGIWFGETASADPYKWCANYTFGTRNCGFVTIEQCRASVSGVGGSCAPNPSYTGPDEKPAKRTRKRHND
jgi:hypothetical protein